MKQFSKTAKFLAVLMSISSFAATSVLATSDVSYPDNQTLNPENSNVYDTTSSNVDSSSSSQLSDSSTSNYWNNNWYDKGTDSVLSKSSSSSSYIYRRRRPISIRSNSSSSSNQLSDSSTSDYWNNNWYNTPTDHASPNSYNDIYNSETSSSDTEEPEIK